MTSRSPVEDAKIIGVVNAPKGPRFLQSSTVANIVPATTYAVAIVSDDDIEKMGSSWSNNAANLSSQVMQAVKASDVGETGDKLNELISLAQQMDPANMTEKKGLMSSLKKLIGKASNDLKARHESVEQRMNTLVGQYQATQDLYARRVVDLEGMFVSAEQIYVGLQRDEALAVQAHAALVAHIASLPPTEGVMDAQRANNLTQRQVRLEQRIDKLKRGQVLAMQMGGQIRIMQENSRVLKQQFVDIIDTTIPAWRQTLSLYILQLEQQAGMNIATATHDATDAALRRSADMLRHTTKGIATLANRSVVNIDTLKHVHTQMLGAISDATAEHAKGRQERLAAEPILAQFRQEMIEGFKAK